MRRGPFNPSLFFSSLSSLMKSYRCDQNLLKELQMWMKSEIVGVFCLWEEGGFPRQILTTSWDSDHGAGLRASQAEEPTEQSRKRLSAETG